MTVLELARVMAPGAQYVVRARHARDVPALERAGATAIASEEYEVGKRLRELVGDALNGDVPKAD